MKWARFSLVAMCMVALTSMAFAGGSADAKSAGAPHGWSSKSPDEMAKEALAKWKGVLKLTDDQVAPFESVMKDSYQKMAEAKTAAAGDKIKMMESMKTIVSDRDAALEKILTADQMKIYREKMEKMAAKGKEHMGKMESMSKKPSSAK